MKSKGYLLLLLSLLVCSSCQSPAQPEFKLVILKQSASCRVNEPALRELRSAAEIKQVFSPATLLYSEEALPEVDGSSQTVMLLAMGLRPSAGYSIELDQTYRHQDEETIRLNVTFRLPKSEMAATMMTSPCVIFAVSQGGWRQIIAGDTGLVYRR